MSDFAVLVLVIALAWATFRQPWLGVLGLAVIAYMSPQGYADGFMREFPSYALLFAVVCVAMLHQGFVTRTAPALWWEWRLAALAALLMWFVVTTYNSALPWVAWPRLTEVSKMLLGLLPTLLLVDTRQKLFLLVVAIAASFALVIFKGGYWALMTGFSDRVYGSPGGHFYGNNEFAIAVAMVIPLLVLWRQQVSGRALKIVLTITVAASVVAVISSWSRGALLTIATLALLMLGKSNRKLITALGIGLGAAGLTAVLPGGWFNRMQTIVGFRGEGSAENRLAVWREGLSYAMDHPVFGAGFEGWRWVSLGPTGGQMDWHNSYVELLAEHGVPGFSLWCVLFVGTLLRLTRMCRLAEDGRAPPWAGVWAGYLRASLAAWAVGGFFLGIAYWDLLYHLIVVCILLERIAERPEAASNPA